MCHTLCMNLIKSLRTYIQKLLDFVPTRLPNGVTEFETWCQSLIDTYGFPDNDSVRFMFAAMIMHLGQTDAYKPKRFFALSGYAAASKEIAKDRMITIKEAHEARAKAEATANAGPKTLSAVPTEATENSSVGGQVS